MEFQNLGDFSIKTALVLGAHPDDEMGCAGLICRLRDAGVDVHALAATLWFLLAGESWYRSRTEWDAGERRSLRTARRLHRGLLDDSLLLDRTTPIQGQERLRWHLTHQVAIAADAAILDGYLTKQVVSEDTRVYTGPDELPSTGRLIAQSMVGSRRNRAEEAADQRERELAQRVQPDDLVNLVLIDLLWLDGEWLLDVPLLERKRLLESIVPGDEFVRPGPYVRPPIATWVGSWRAQGFLAIGSRDGNHFHPGKSMDFLVRLGELVSAALASRD